MRTFLFINGVSLSRNDVAGRDAGNSSQLLLILSSVWLTSFRRHDRHRNRDRNNSSILGEIREFSIPSPTDAIIPAILARAAANSNEIYDALAIMQLLRNAPEVRIVIADHNRLGMIQNRVDILDRKFGNVRI